MCIFEGGAVQMFSPVQTNRNKETARCATFIHHVHVHIHIQINVER